MTRPDDAPRAPGHPAPSPRRLVAGLTTSLARLAVILAVLLAALPSTAAPVRVGTADRIDLTAATDWCETTPQTSAATVAAGGCRFVPATANDLAHGYSASAFWLRLTLVGTEDPPTRRLLLFGNSRLERVEFFDLLPDGPRSIGVSGLAVAPGARLDPSDVPLLPLTLAPGVERPLLVRVVSRSSINLVPVLWRERAWLDGHGRFVFHVVLANGGLLTAGLFSLLVAFVAGISQWSRRANLYFAAGSFAKALFNLANAALLPIFVLPRDRSYDIRFQAVALAAALGFSLLFLRHFLDTRRRYPTLEIVFRLLLAMLVLTAVWAQWVDYASGFQAMVVVVGFAFVAGVGATWKAFYDGVPGTLALVFASSLHVVLLGLRIVRAFTGAEFDDVLTIAFSWGSFLSAPLIPIGIALHEESIRHDLEAARADAEARIAFLARMSHELRTPLDTILGNAQLIARPGGRVTVAEGVATILDAGRHLLRMIDDILDHARGLAGRLPLAPSPVDWPTFLGNLELEGRVLAARNRNDFALVHRGPSVTTLELDEGRLRQILDNLLANAARHTHDGRIELACTVGPIGTDGATDLDFAVVDTGEGIAATDLERIFLPFEHGGASVRAGGKGMGMGLTIARQLVERMGGRLTVESRVGEGATFRFRITVRALPDEIAAPTAEAPSARPEGPSQSVLVVDDEPVNRRLLATLLADCGLEVVEAGSGNAAVDLCRAGLRPALVLTDQFMDDGDGWSVLRALADVLPGVPVVSVSAAPPRRPDGFPETLAFAAHLMRPLDHVEVLRRVGDVLGRPVVPIAVEPAPPPQTEADPARRPDAAAMDRLRSMIDDGRVSDILDWAEAVKTADPAIGPFADAVAAAAHRLDFPRLAALAEG